MPLCLAHLEDNNIDEVRMLELAFDERDQYMYPHMHKKHAYSLPRIESAFRSMKANGAYERYFQQVFTPLAHEQQ